MTLLTNLVAYWKLDESSGNASDSSGGGFTLTNNNTVAYVSAKINNGADFGTANSNKNLVNTTRTGTVNMDRSISMWIKINTDLTGGDTYTDVFEWAYGSSSNFVGYQVGYIRESSVNAFRVNRDRGCVGGESVKFNGPTASGGFYHVVMTVSSNTMSLYVNNSFVSSIALNTGNGSCNSQDGFYVGSNRVGSGFSSVTVDEVGVWSKALTAGEITQLYNSGNGLSYPFTSSNSNFFAFF